MYKYECHICGGQCDAGELENGVCHECRERAVAIQECHQMRVRKELNQLIDARLEEQRDGQLILGGILK